MDQEEAPPPPYSAVDPLLAPTNNSNTNASQGQVTLREDGSSLQAAGNARASRQESSSSAAMPTHFTSAVTYFEQRPPTIIDESRAILRHHMTIYPRSSAKDFPRRPRCWGSRTQEVAQQDWDTFLRYLFPPQLGLAAASQHLPRQLRAEIQRDRKDRPQETDEERRARITAVVDEWNECFFELRATQIVFVYIGEPDAAPASALCPRCYPAATKATQSTGTPGFVEGQPAQNQNVPSPVPGPHIPSPTSWHPPPTPPFANSPQPPMPYGAPYVVPPFYTHGPPPNHQPPQYYPPRPPPPGVAPWQWNNWAYSQPQYGNSGTSKSGSLGWISQLTSSAQKYGERFAEQAQHYGDQISAQAMHYGRQVEEHAMAHSRWIDEQARFHGRKPGAYPPAGYPIPPSWGSPQPQSPHSPNGQVTGVVQNQPPPTSNNQNTASTPASRPEIRNQSSGKDKLPADVSTERSIDRPRRASIGSVSSNSSLSSIDSISTTSDLGASDLATVRTQLQCLDDRHDRILHEAAVDLRRQLDVLKESRRAARSSGRRWRPGLLNQQGSSRQDSSDWGRWDSPEEQQRQATERRAMKEEMRATRKAFRDVTRRAREEQREKRRARRNRRRQTRPDDTSLNGHMGNLALQDSATRPARVHSEPLSQVPQPQATQHTPPVGPMRSQTATSSDFSVSSARNTPSSASQASTPDSTAEVPDRRTRIKDILKSRNAKKQQQSRAAENAPTSAARDGKPSKKGT